MGLSPTRNFSTVYQRLWKASTLLVLTSMLLFIISQTQSVSNTIILEAAAIGTFQAFALLLVGRLLLWKLPDTLHWLWLRVFFAPYPTASIGFLLSCVISFLLYIAFLPPLFQSVDLLSTVGLAYISGSSFAVIIFGCFPFKMENSSIIYRVSSERYDAFLGTLVASSILGSALIGASQANSTEWAGILVPLYFSIATLLLTFLGAVITEYNRTKNNWWYMAISIVAAVALIGSASGITSHALPSLLFINGKEVTSYQIFLAMQIGVIAGWIAGNMVKLYYFIARSIIQYILKHPIRNVFIGFFLRFVLNSGIAVTPAIVAIVAIGLSYFVADIYGASLAILGIVSNVGVSLAIGNNPLSRKHMESLSFAQRKKLELLLPSYKTLGLKMIKNS